MDNSMDAPDIERNFDTIRRIRRVTMRAEAKGRGKNMPRDIQVQVEKERNVKIIRR